MVLDGPSLGIQLLPIIGSPEPEDTPTPMVETTNFATALQGHANGVMMMATGDKRNRNNLGLNGLGHRESQRQQQGMMANSSVRFKGLVLHHESMFLAKQQQWVSEGMATGQREDGGQRCPQQQQRQSDGKHRDTSKHSNGQRGGGEERQGEEASGEWGG